MLYDYYVDMSDTNSSSRHNRHSVYQASGSSSILNILKARIKAASNKSSWNEEAFDPMNPGCIVHKEQIVVNKKIKTIRRVYMSEDHKYKAGWVVDADLDICMLCFGGFGWLNLKHHCRACGFLVCGKCSQYNTVVPHITEENGSRVCKSCFSLQAQGIGYGTHIPAANNSPYTDRHSVASIPNTPISVTNSVKKSNTPASVMTPNNNYNNSSFSTPQSTLAARRASAAAMSGTGASGGGFVGRRSSSGMVMSVEDLARLEKQLEPRYREANEKMRHIIPMDLFKISFAQLVEYGVPTKIANRIWNNKILWMIVMHPDDIAKIHMADLRSKYIATGLDVLEMRAVWYNLPNWVTVSDGAVDSSGIVDQAKGEWKIGFKSRLDDLAYKESRNTLSGNLLRNEAYDGYEDLHLFNHELPLQRRFDNGASYSTNGGNGNSNNYVNDSVGSVTSSNNDFRFDEGVGGKTKNYIDHTTRSMAAINQKNGGVADGKKKSAAATLFNRDNGSDDEEDEINDIPIGHLEISESEAGSIVEDDMLERMSMGRGGGKDTYNGVEEEEEEYDPLDDIYNYNKPYGKTGGSVASKEVKPAATAAAPSHHHQKQQQQQREDEAAAQKKLHLSLRTHADAVAAAAAQKAEEEEEETLADDLEEDPLLEEGGYEYGRTSSVGSETTKMAVAYFEQQKVIEMQAAQIEEMKRQQELQQAMMFQQQQSQALSSNTNRVLSRFYSESNMSVPGQLTPQPSFHVPPAQQQQQQQYPQASSSFTSTNSFMTAGGTTVSGHHPLAQTGRSHSVAYMPSPSPAGAAAPYHQSGGYISPMVPGGVTASGGPHIMMQQHPSMQSPVPQFVDAYGNPVAPLHHPQQQHHHQATSPMLMHPSYNPSIRSGHSTPQQQFYHPPMGPVSGVQPHGYAGSGSGGHNPYLIPSGPSPLPHAAAAAAPGGYYGDPRYSPVPPQSVHPLPQQHPFLQGGYNPGEITPPRSAAMLVHRASLGAMPTTHGSSHSQLMVGGGSGLNSHNGSAHKLATRTNIQAINEHVNQSFAHQVSSNSIGLDTVSIAEKQLTPRSCLSVTSEADENTFNSSNPAEVPPGAAPSVSSASSLSGTVSVHSNNLSSHVIQVNSPLNAAHTHTSNNVNEHLTVHHLASPTGTQSKKGSAKLNPPLTETGSSSSSSNAVKSTVNSSSTELYPHLQVVQSSTPMTVSSDTTVAAASAANIKSPPRKKLVHASSLSGVPLSSSGAPAAVASPVLQVSRQELHDRLVYAIQMGNGTQANAALKLIQQETAHNPQITANAVVDSVEASQLLLSCYEQSSELQQPVDLLTVLVDVLKADINTQHPETGSTVLHYAIGQSNRILCASMLKRGSNILLNDAAGVSPLALSLNQDIDWLLIEFESCGKEAEFIRTADQLSLFQYATTLILSGYAKRASRIIKEGKVAISAEDATELLSNCQGNFSNMKEPMEIFELLDSLGAKM